MSAALALARRLPLGALVVVGLFGAAAHAQGPNRLWLGRVELEGPLERVELDCGDAGATAIEAALVAGERRELVVPLPWAPPLGVEGLARHAPPLVRVAPEGGGGRARWLGVVAGEAGSQPDERWARLPVGVRVRPRPPAGAEATGGGASVGALLVVLAAQIAIAGLVRRGRARLAISALVAVGGGAAAFALAARALSHRGAPTVLIDADLPAAGPPTVLRVTAATTELGLPRREASLRVETRPEGARLEFTVDPATDRWTLRGPGEVLVFESAPSDAAGAALAPAWWRDAAGAWSGFAALERERPGELGRRPAAPPLPPGEAVEPPGWLRAGLPPGRTALLGRLAGEEAWLRATGVPAPGGQAPGEPGPERD